jgi:hypothetical protein
MGVIAAISSTLVAALDAELGMSMPHRVHSEEGERATGPDATGGAAIDSPLAPAQSRSQRQRLSKRDGGVSWGDALADS